MNVLVTGANGFVGRALIARFRKKPALHLRAAVRQSGHHMLEGAEVVAVGDLHAATDWRSALKHIDVLIHAAAHVHITRGPGRLDTKDFFAVNVDGTLNLARQAAAAGVRRFVFLSSIKVNGESTLSGRPFRANDPPMPADPYATSKWAAEKGLREVSSETGLEVVILRPPLVYGPGVKANFLGLMKMVQRGVPLPFASTRNQRSLIYIGNLVDAVGAVSAHPRAAGQTFLISDARDLSTPNLIRELAAAMGTTARLFPFPAGLMLLAAKLPGVFQSLAKLTGSLQLDCGWISEAIGWQPPFCIPEGFRQTAAWYHNIRARKDGF